MSEDGTIGIRLKITATNPENVYYYVQRADKESIPEVVQSEVADKNTAEEGNWFKAGSENIITLAANTEYVVYTAKLEDTDHQCSSILSTRSIRTKKEDLAKITEIKVTPEIPSGAESWKWKVLQEMELRIASEGKAVSGVWQYYVSTTKAEGSWQNITSQIKAEVREGSELGYTYTKIKMPQKYTDYYVNAVFTGRGAYEGEKDYVSTDKLSGTPIKGHALITSGSESKILVPITVAYVCDGEVEADVTNGIWTWYRQIGETENYEEITSARHIGATSSYTPQEDDIGKKIYAMYSAPLTGAYSGSVESEKLKSVVRKEQAKPIGLD